MSRRVGVLLLPGDGIGEEVCCESRRVLERLSERGELDVEIDVGVVGGASYDRIGVPISASTLSSASSADAVLFGAVGGPKWEGVPYDSRPESALLRLRKELGLFANLRPAICHGALADSSSLKRDKVEGLDILIVRELTGGVYFGSPKEIVVLEDGRRRAVDSQIYFSDEIERIARVAFESARKRSGKVHSVEKHNVMKSGALWRRVVSEVGEVEYPDVELSHMLADNCAMQLVAAPKQFDVILADNLFGDLLSDVAAALTGSLGMLPSASLGAPDSEGRRRAMYEPVHGSAPDIAGKGIANPIAMLASTAMALRHSLGVPSVADRLESAISAALSEGFRTRDIAAEGENPCSTSEMTDAILDQYENLP